MIYFLMLVASAIGISGNFSVTKIYQKTMGTALYESAVFNTLVGLFGAIFFWALYGFNIEFTPYSALIAFIISMLVGGYTMIGFKIMSMGSMTVYTLFLMLGGAIVPYIYGLLFLGESVNVSNIIALLLIAVSVILNSGKKISEKQSVKFLLLCLAVFLINGATSVFAKIHQIETEFKTVSSESFVILKNIARFLSFGLILPFCKNKTKAFMKMPKSMYLVMLASAVISSFSYLFQLIGASNLPATILYPVVTGGSVVFTSIFDRVFFNQKLHKRTIIGIVICVIALPLFVIE